MMAAALGALLVRLFAMLALPVALRQLIDHGLAAKDAGTINQYFIGFLAAAVIFGAFCRAALLSGDLAGRTRGRGLAFGCLPARRAHGSPVLRDHSVGEVLSRLTTDTTLVQAISGVNLSIILRSSLSLIGGLIMLGLTSAKLMGVILVLIPVVVVPLIVIGRRVRGLSRASQDRIADTSGLAGETLNAIQTVQAFTLEELQSERYRKGGRRQLCHRSTPHTRARGAHGDRHHAGVCGHHLRLVAGCAPGPRRHDDGGQLLQFCSTLPSSAVQPPHSLKCGARCSALPAPWSA